MEDAEQVLRLLRERGETVATAESLTGGLVAAALVDVPGASAAYVGGLVTYATRLKTDLLGVPQDVVDEHGVVSGQCALAMARGARATTGATWAVATTGVAGPDEQEGQPAGTVHVAVAGPGERTVRLGLPGDRGAVRRAAVAEALSLLRVVVEDADRGGCSPGQRPG